MSLAVDLAKDPAAIAEAQKDGRFKKGSDRAREAGRKGGSKPHPTGSKIGKTYKHRGYIVKWDKKKNLWEATDKVATIYARSFREIKEAIDEWEAKNAFIETPEAK